MSNCGSDSDSVASATADQDGATDKLTQEERRAQICLFLRTRVVKKSRGEGFRIKFGTFDEAARKFGCGRHSVQHVWARHKDAICEPDKYELDVARKKGSGCKRKRDLEDVRALVERVPPEERGSLRSLSERVGIPKSTLRRILQECGLADGPGGKNEAAGDGGPTLSQKTRSEMRMIQLEQAKADEVEEAKAEAKAEARREHNLQMKEMRKEFVREKREMRNEYLSEKAEMREQLQEERSRKDAVLYRLRMEMERHSVELAKLKDELDEIGYDSVSKGDGGGSAEKSNEGGLC